MGRGGGEGAAPPLDCASLHVLVLFVFFLALFVFRSVGLVFPLGTKGRRRSRARFRRDRMAIRLVSGEPELLHLLLFKDMKKVMEPFGYQESCIVVLTSHLQGCVHLPDRDKLGWPNLIVGFRRKTAGWGQDLGLRRAQEIPQLPSSWTIQWTTRPHTD